MEIFVWMVLVSIVLFAAWLLPPEQGSWRKWWRARPRHKDPE